MASKADEIVEPARDIPTTRSADSVPTVYADISGYVYLQHGNLRFTLVENIADAPESAFPGWKARPVINVVMPVSSAEGMLAYIGAFLAQMKARDAANAPK